MTNYGRIMVVCSCGPHKHINMIILVFIVFGLLLWIFLSDSFMITNLLLILNHHFTSESVKTLLLVLPTLLLCFLIVGMVNPPEASS